MAATSPRITIVDYGIGNLRSVAKALERSGARAELSADPERIKSAAGLVLPGVGAFGAAMRRIEERDLAGQIRDFAATGRPLLGICLGMQLLFDGSEERGGAAGLGLLEGGVERLRAGDMRLPLIGWEPLHVERPGAPLEGIAEGEPFYFVHSFAARPRPEDLIASAEHGERFAAVVGRDNVLGAQFHPEKSSAAGLRLLRNFVTLTRPAPLPA